MSHTLNSYQIELPDISPLSFLSKSVLMQHIFCVEASPHNGVEACYLTVSKLMVSPVVLFAARILQKWQPRFTVRKRPTRVMPSTTVPDPLPNVTFGINVIVITGDLGRMDGINLWEHFIHLRLAIPSSRGTRKNCSSDGSQDWSNSRLFFVHKFSFF